MELDTIWRANLRWSEICKKTRFESTRNAPGGGHERNNSEDGDLLLRGFDSYGVDTLLDGGGVMQRSVASNLTCSRDSPTEFTSPRHFKSDLA